MSKQKMSHTSDSVELVKETLEHAQTSGERHTILMPMHAHISVKRHTNRMTTCQTGVQDKTLMEVHISA